MSTEENTELQFNEQHITLEKIMAAKKMQDLVMNFKGSDRSLQRLVMKTEETANSYLKGERRRCDQFESLSAEDRERWMASKYENWPSAF